MYQTLPGNNNIMLAYDTDSFIAIFIVTVLLIAKTVTVDSTMRALVQALPLEDMMRQRAAMSAEGVSRGTATRT